MTCKIDVYLRNTIDGFTDIYHDDWDYPEPFNSCMWYEGNYSCDCNRSYFLYNWDNNKELDCNIENNIIIIDKIVRRDTGEILYSESLVDGIFTRNIRIINEDGILTNEVIHFVD